MRTSCGACFFGEEGGTDLLRQDIVVLALSEDVYLSPSLPTDMAGMDCGVCVHD
jgi:hypothetical protein